MSKYRPYIVGAAGGVLAAAIVPLSGIIDYDGAWIGAGPKEINRKADLRETYYNDENPDTPQGPARFRQYTP